MPYLDQGEFYSEFGNYKVRITLPANYVVAATGDLQEESEKQFNASRMVPSDSSMVLIDTPVVSASMTKTISFRQSDVHDFAWFADKTYSIENTEVLLPSGKKQCATVTINPGAELFTREVQR